MYKYCFECQNKIKNKQLTCCQLVFFLEFNEQSLVILWVNWVKNESFRHRFTCKKCVNPMNLMFWFFWRKKWVDLIINSLYIIRLSVILSFGDNLGELLWSRSLWEHHWPDDNIACTMGSKKFWENWYFFTKIVLFYCE